MKKLTTIFAAGLLLLLVSCGTKKEEKADGADATVTANLNGNHTVMDAFSTGDVSKIDSVVAADFVDHTDRGDMGRDSLKAGIIKMHEWDKTMKMEVVKELADKDYVFSWIKTSGTSNGDMGMPKGAYTMNSIEVTRFKDSKAVEHWGFMEIRDAIRMMSGMGAAAPAEKKMATDTAR